MTDNTNLKGTHVFIAVLKLNKSEVCAIGYNSQELLRVFNTYINGMSRQVTDKFSCIRIVQHCQGG